MGRKLATFFRQLKHLSFARMKMCIRDRLNTPAALFAQPGYRSIYLLSGKMPSSTNGASPVLSMPWAVSYTHLLVPSGSAPRVSLCSLLTIDSIDLAIHLHPRHLQDRC